MVAFSKMMVAGCLAASANAEGSPRKLFGGVPTAPKLAQPSLRASAYSPSMTAPLSPTEVHLMQPDAQTSGARVGAPEQGWGLGVQGAAVAGVAAASAAIYVSKRARAGTTSMQQTELSTFAEPLVQDEVQPVQPAVFVTAPSNLPDYGQNVFRGAVAEKYLKKNGQSAKMLENNAWTNDPKKADAMARALRDWAVERGATSYCHWFQPLGACGVRPGGGTAGVQINMLNFDADGNPSYEFSGKELLTGETDGSSYPNGGLRATHTAGGYLAIDPLSPPWIREDVMFIPAAFIAYTGQALDEKTPLHRSCEALSKEGKRMLSAMGVETSGLVANIGLEQEFFLVPRDAYYMRPDLQFVGRTLIGKEAARGQEMSDHYMAPLASSTAALQCMQAIQEECYRIGIPLKTRHREVAPNQYEFAPLFGDCRVQTDQNLVVMQIMEETASRFGLAALLQEKPFSGINGSGKHNNWSFSTNEGMMLLNPEQVLAKTGNADLFAVTMAAVVRGVDLYGDLIRMSIASPGNDFRLGAMEAPPAVLSTYLGPSLTDYLTKYMNGEDLPGYSPEKSDLSFGVDTLKPMQVPAEDRNRTSPFPYGGNRFEFRAAGSSQNVSLVNTVLNTLTAEGMKVIADRVGAGETPKAVAQDLLKKHMKCVFNGDGYDPEWPEEAVKKGIWRIDRGVDAICEMTSDKNLEFFGSMGVLSAEEAKARQDVLLEHYVGVVDMEAKCLKDMITQLISPFLAEKKLDGKKVADGAKLLEKRLKELEKAAEDDIAKAAKMAYELRFGDLASVREACDACEAACEAEGWPLASYKELLFLDSHTSVPA
jgi:glutamine synthetase